MSNNPLKEALMKYSAIDLKEIAVGDLKIYVKKELSVSEMTRLLSILEEDSFRVEKQFALLALNNDGAPIFNIDNEEDLKSIGALPFHVITPVLEQAGANGNSKNGLTTDKNS